MFTRTAPTPYCRHIGKSRLVRTQAVNGAWRVTRQCLDCQQTFGQSLAKAPGWDSLPVVDTGYRNEPCAVRGCSETFTEYQHWLPQALDEQIGEVADDWPGAYLCRRHHMLWHGLVTPGLVSEGDKVYQQYVADHRPALPAPAERRQAAARLMGQIGVGRREQG